MPALVGPLVGFAIGVLFAWAASEELARSHGTILGTRGLAIVVLFGFLVFGPFAGYFVTYATDWSFAYLLDGRRTPSALLLMLVLADIGSVPLGFAVGARRAQQRKIVTVLPWITVPLALVAIFVAVFARKLGVHGTFGQVSRGFGGATLSGSPVGHAILWLGACLVAGIAWTAQELRTSR